MLSVMVDPDDLLSDLSLMRKGRGFTADRLRGAGTLRECLGAGDAEEAYPQLRERLLSAIHSLHDGDAVVLLAAFGFDEQTADMQTLHQRRQYLGRKVGRSVETIANREAASLVALRNQLTSGWYPDSPMPVRVPQLHNGVHLQSVDIHTVVQHGVWVETREHHTFVAAFDEADYITVSLSYPAVLQAAGEFSVRTRRSGASFSHDFYHQLGMRRGQTYNLRFLARPTASMRKDQVATQWLTQTSRAFHEAVRDVRFTVDFGDAPPQMVQRFERCSPFEQPDQASTVSNLSEIRPGVYEARFYDQYGGLFCGLAWQWSAPDTCRSSESKKEGLTDGSL